MLDLASYTTGAVLARVQGLSLPYIIQICLVFWTSRCNQQRLMGKLMTFFSFGHPGMEVVLMILIL